MFFSSALRPLSFWALAWRWCRCTSRQSDGCSSGVKTLMSQIAHGQSSRQVSCFSPYRYSTLGELIEIVPGHGFVILFPCFFMPSGSPSSFFICLILGNGDQSSSSSSRQPDFDLYCSWSGD